MRLYCQIPDLKEAWIELPEVWLGKHAQRRDQAIEAAEKYKSNTLTEFAVAMALLDNWNLPGLAGNPDAWDFTLLDLRLMAWVRNETLQSFGRCFIVPKGSPEPLQPGQDTNPTATNLPGGSETQALPSA